MTEYAKSGMWLRSLLVRVIALTFATSASASGLQIQLAIDGCMPISIEPNGHPGFEPNTMQYSGGAAFDSTSLSWQINATGAADVATLAKLLGTVSVTNHAVAPQAYVVTVRQPALTGCPVNNVAGGATFATLLIDTGGGSVMSPKGEPLWRGLIDGKVVATLLDDVHVESPFWGTTVIGPDSFGDPIPSDDAPGVADSIGLQFAFTLSGGETFSISSVYLVGFLDFFCPNPADLDGDGIVGGADLGLLLAAWGSDDPFADLDGDGVVDGSDLGLLLQAWTEF